MWREGTCLQLVKVYISTAFLEGQYSKFKASGVKPSNSIFGVFPEEIIKNKKMDRHPTLYKSERLETLEMYANSGLVKMQQCDYMQPLKV